MKFFQILVLAVPLVAAVQANAATNSFDGVKSLICSSSRVVVCTEVATCVEAIPEEVELPRFFAIDASGKKITATWPSEAAKVSQVTTLQDFDDRLVLQGMDTEVPWSATIDKESGSLVATQSRLHVSFTVFGACMPN